MRPLRIRDDLLALVAQHAPSTACSRAISEDRAEVLGGFTPAKGLPYFLVRVLGKHGQTWYIQVDCDEERGTYRVRRRTDEIAWTEWQGRYTKRHAANHRPLIDGDEPERYSLRRAMARSHR